MITDEGKTFSQPVFPITFQGILIADVFDIQMLISLRHLLKNFITFPGPKNIQRLQNSNCRGPAFAAVGIRLWLMRPYSKIYLFMSAGSHRGKIYLKSEFLTRTFARFIEYIHFFHLDQRETLL